MFEQALIDKLYSRVIKQENGCWTHHQSIKHKSKTITVFRIAYFAKYPTLQIPKKVYRTCENFLCINPDHICKDHYEYAKYVINDPNTYELTWNDYLQDYCHSWTRGNLIYGYGTMHLNNRREQVIRLVLTLDNIDLTNLVVRHKCHNRACIKRSHLTYGTVAENIQDTVDANRQAKGEQIGTSVLTEQQVLIIVELLKTTSLSCFQIARRMEIKESTVKNICFGSTWNHLTNMPKGTKRSDWHTDKQLSLF